jgi:hypothetical protein
MSKYRNQNLKTRLSTNVKSADGTTAVIPKPNTNNISGNPAYQQDKWLRLLTMLNTLKMENQFYRTESQTMAELKALIHSCATDDAYLTAQCIVYSRCVGEGMRSISHLSATYLAPYVAGLDWSRRFYGLWNKKEGKGGVIFRADDMSEIAACYSFLNVNPKTNKPYNITNAMKKGFKESLESLDSYALLKYKSSLLDLINVVHPDPKSSKALVPYNEGMIPTFEAIIKGYSVSADTWEVAQSGAGQEVAKAVKEGKISSVEAEKVLKEAKAENWTDLLAENKLGILAAIRNIRSILSAGVKGEIIKNLCELLSNKEAILKGKIMPYQIDMANEVIMAEFNSSESRMISQSLLSGYEVALPNLRDSLSGDTLVMLDQSGSMWMRGNEIQDPNRKLKYTKLAGDKAALIAATIAKATNGDVILFGSDARYANYNPNQDVFSIAKGWVNNMGGTSLSAAWTAAQKSGRNYTRVFILSDNECNKGSSYEAYKSYIQNIGNPYVYSIDLAAYGTTQLIGDKVRFYYGFGYSMFEDIAKSEFNPNHHLDKVKSIEI